MDLEKEAISIMREVAGQFAKPILLFSGGKDSIVMTRIAELAFRPGKFPFPLMLIDTGHNFPETTDFIKSRMAELNEKLIIKKVQDTIDQGLAVEETGLFASRNRLQSITLMEAIREFEFDAIIGGARRDEEKARAKERIFSHRNEFGEWDPKNQRPEPWNLLNGKIKKGEQIRVFPLSNWTELDIWNYIKDQKLKIPSIYFSHERMCVTKGEMILADSPFLRHNLTPEKKQVRFRTVGDMTCTAGLESAVTSIDGIIQEIKKSNYSERGFRADDKVSETSMEDRKKEGYF